MRVTSRLVGIVIALAVLASAVLAIIEAGLALVGADAWVVRGPSTDDLARLTWAAPSWRLAALAILAAGVALLAWAWWPRPALTVPVRQDGSGTLRVRRASVEATVAARVREQPFVTDAEVTVRSGAVHVRAGTTRPANPDEQASVRDSVRRAVQALGLDPERVHVQIRAGARRAA